MDLYKTHASNVQKTAQNVTLLHQNVTMTVALMATVWLLQQASAKNVSWKIVQTVNRTAVFATDVALDSASLNNQTHQCVSVIRAKVMAAINAKNQSLIHATAVPLVMDSFSKKMEATLSTSVKIAPKQTA